jgi:hypothetical protein
VVVSTALTAERWRGRRRGRPVTAAVLAVALAVLGSACGDPAYQFVSNRDQGNFFKVPSSWDLQNITHTQNEGRPEAEPGGILPLWHMVFAADVAGDGLDTDPEGNPTELQGSAEIYVIADYYRENFSLSSIRSQLFRGVDPLYPPDELQAKVERVGYEQLTGGEGLTGSRVVANIDLAADGEDPNWVTMDVSMLFDNRLGRIYVLSMRCTATCYLANRAAIDEVAASWTVRQ